MAEKRKINMPVADDVVQVEAPKAEATGSKTAEQARAERQAGISVAGSKKEPTPAKPAFVPNQAKIQELYAMDDEALVARAVKDAAMPVAASGDRRLFVWTGSRTDGLRGQPVDRSKLRSAIVAFLQNRTAENGKAFSTEDKAILAAARAVGREKQEFQSFVHGNDEAGHTIDHVAEGRVIHAFMFLAGPEVHGGKYDIGYVATRRGDNKSRGMVARGYLRIIGDATPPAVAEAQVAQEAAVEAVDPETAAKE